MAAKAKQALSPVARKSTLRRVLRHIAPYGGFVALSLAFAAVNVVTLSLIHI